MGQSPVVLRITLVVVLALVSLGCSPPPVLIPSQPVVSFGDVYVGTTAQAPNAVTWTNGGGSPATVTAFNLAGASAGNFSAAPANAFANTPPVQPRQATPGVTFSFTPTAEGAVNAVAALALSAGAQTPVVLVGNGRHQIQVGDLAFLGGGNLQPGRWLDFGRLQVAVDPPKTRRFRVTNMANGAVQVTEIVFAVGGQGFTLNAATPPVPFVLNAFTQPGDSQMIDIDFKPPAFTAPPRQKRFTDAVTVKGQAVGNPAQKHSYGTTVCGVGYYLPPEETELKC